MLKYIVKLIHLKLKLMKEIELIILIIPNVNSLVKNLFILSYINILIFRLIYAVFLQISFLKKNTNLKINVIS